MGEPLVVVVRVNEGAGQLRKDDDEPGRCLPGLKVQSVSPIVKEPMLTDAQIEEDAAPDARRRTRAGPDCRA